MFKDLLLLADGGGNILDVITKHVVTEGLSEKLRLLRGEFYSKSDFRTAELRFVDLTKFDAARNGLEEKIKRQG